jgi:hypothetical protein
MTQTTVARVPLKRPPLVAVKPDLNIDQRIAAAFGNKVTSADVANLIQDVELALIEAGEASNLARAQALSPLLSMDEVAVARQLMQDAQFRQCRLEIAITKLRERLNWLRAQEEDAKRRAVYDQVQEQRDALAKELADTYPELASKLAEILGRIVANDAEIARLKLPDGRGRPLGAELVARGLQHFQTGPQNLSFIPSMTERVCLPSFKYEDGPLLWPRR